MKNPILFVLAMLLGLQAIGQKKMSKEEAAALEVDTLTRINKELTVKLDSVNTGYKAQTMALDSVNKSLTANRMLYAAVKEKVMKRDFDPNRTAVLIDSLQAVRSGPLGGLTKEAQMLSDTMNVVQAENASLKASLAEWKGRAAINEQVAKELEQLKGLLDQKIITQTEFDIRKSKVMARWR